MISFGFFIKLFGFINKFAFVFQTHFKLQRFEEVDWLRLVLRHPVFELFSGLKDLPNLRGGEHFFLLEEVQVLQSVLQYFLDPHAHLLFGQITIKFYN